MGGLRKHLPWTYRDHADRHPGHRRGARPGRFLQQGRDPVESLEQRPSGCLADAVARRRHDGLLHVPAAVPDLLGPGTHGRAHEAPHPRIAEERRVSAGRAGGAVGHWRICGASRAGLGSRIVSSISWSRCCGCPPPEHAVEHSAGQELLFTGLSVAIAAGRHLPGLSVLRRQTRYSPIGSPRGSKGFYELVYHKYYVDELYDALFVNRTKDLGNALLLCGLQVRRRRRQRNRGDDPRHRDRVAAFSTSTSSTGW